MNRTISLISHANKVILKIIFNRLVPQAEEIITDEQAGFQHKRSNTKPILNLMQKKILATLTKLPPHLHRFQRSL